MTDLKPVIYAEDDENDVFLMQRAFSKLQIENPLEIVPDGKLTMAYLEGAKPYEGRPEPCLMLMDLSMPGKSGLEVLEWLKNKPSPLSSLPVVVLTSSNQESDIHRSYSLGADGYLIKPGDPKKLLSIIKLVKDFWLSEKRPPGRFLDFANSANVIPQPNRSQDSHDSGAH